MPVAVPMASPAAVNWPASVASPVLPRAGAMRRCPAAVCSRGRVQAGKAVMPERRGQNSKIVRETKTAVNRAHDAEGVRHGKAAHGACPEAVEYACRDERGVGIGNGDRGPVEAE